MKTNWILPSLVAMAVSGAAVAAPQSYLYKDTRTMAMGGASVATGGYSTAVFSNPAGLAKLPTDHGMIVELLGFQATATQNGTEIFTDLADASDSGDSSDIEDVLEKYAGQPVYIDFSNYSSVSYNHGDIAWSIGLLAATDINVIANPYNISVLELQTRAYGGVNAGVSYTLRDMWLGDLSLGLGGKFYGQNSYEDVLDPDDILDFEGKADEIIDEASETNTAFAFDLGAIYQFNVPLKPSFGLSIMNIGGLDFDDAYGSQPMTVNIGGAVEPEIPFIKRTRIAIDYVDVLNANTFRIYDYNPDEDGLSYRDVESNDIIQQLNLGMSALLYDNTWSSLELAAGLYQGNWTAGIDFAASIFKLSFASYAEEVGPVSGDKTDRRYTASLGLGW
ncbi:conjugal transfer protein TraF [Vibrio ulleungensis]|uniref:Conjugal transfer protein TraF n=1 Tax=Vibrio ulleungensis TaxID=2807619 RepID=A0ABS2HDB2_9VIBR|nr:conjugal transfer protein TraF [Vibrio ulleungensis]MBM7034984.1 conjugal transfer protein TraF [Vibrio ulleungensis]